MHNFRDAEGREWQLTLDIGTAKRIRDATGYQLIKETDLREIADDLGVFVDVLYVALENEAARHDVDDEAFGVMLTECFPAAADAWFEELATFCRKLGRNALATLAETIHQATQKVDKRATQMLTNRKMDELIDQTMAEADRTLEESLARFRGRTSTN